MKTVEKIFGQLKSLVREPNEKPAKALVLLHGVGSNEQNLLDISPSLTDDRLIISLRAPITIGPGAYAWFHVRFTEQGPVHNWDEAKSSLKLLEEALSEISGTYGIPFDHISVFGFSQGAIMTVGLSLASQLDLERYAAASGRTLPEWSQAAQTSPLSNYSKRRVFVSHGTLDSKLSIALGRNTEVVLRNAGLNLTYKEYEFDHGISEGMTNDIKKWLKSP